MEIDIILSPKQAQSFRDRINQDGTDAHAIDEALEHVKSENAEASVQADLDAIRILIQKYRGGFGTLNDTVKQYLRKWFVSQGGVKVVARHGKRGGGAASWVASSSGRERTGIRGGVSASDPTEEAAAIATTTPVAKTSFGASVHRSLAPQQHKTNKIVPMAALAAISTPTITPQLGP